MNDKESVLYWIIRVFPQTELASVGVLAVLIEGPVVITHHRGAKWPPTFVAIYCTLRHLPSKTRDFSILFHGKVDLGKEG